MENITDMNGYLKRMTNGMADKLWFIEHAPMDKINLILDFGCADGTMLREVAKLYPHIQCFGFDSSEIMIQMAREHDNPYGIIYTSDWTEMRRLWKEYSGNIFQSLVILSSVCHEFISYEVGPRKSWDRINALGPTYIAIRDMYNEDKDVQTPAIWESSMRIDTDEERLAEFECEYGSIGVLRNFVHALLKLPYEANWSREMCEDYVAVTREYINHRSWYRTIYRKEYTLPYLKQLAKDVYDIDNFDVVTHQNVLLKNNSVI